MIQCHREPNTKGGKEKVKNTDKQALYTSAETMALLGISSSTLRSLVEKELIKKVTRPGYTHGRYTKESVDQYHRQQLLFEEKYTLDNEEEIKREDERSLTKMSKIETIEDMKEVQDLSQEIFGVGAGTEKERMKIVEKNPDTYYILRKGKEAIGYLSTMPLKKGNLENILGQTLPVKVEPDQIEKFEKGKKIDLYLTAIGVKPGFSTEEKHEYGSRLVRQLIKLILELGRRGVEIGNIAARSSMPDGIRLMKHIGFTEVIPLTPERRTFIINIEESGIPFVLQYKKLLEESKISDFSEIAKITSEKVKP